MHDQSAGELIASIAAKKTEQLVLLRQLAMWAEVQKQGVSPETVDVFGFDPKLMTDDERREARRAAHAKFETRLSYRDNNPYCWPVEHVNGRLTIRVRRYNFVRLKTGEQVRLTPMIDRPEAV